MTTLSELQDKLKTAQADVSDLQAKIETFEGPTVWPQVWDKYFLIEGGGDVCSRNWDSHNYDRLCLEMGNAFRTREEAEREVKRRKVTAKLRAIAAKQRLS